MSHRSLSHAHTASPSLPLYPNLKILNRHVNRYKVKFNPRYLTVTAARVSLQIHESESEIELENTCESADMTSVASKYHVDVSGALPCPADQSLHKSGHFSIQEISFRSATLIDKAPRCFPLALHEGRQEAYTGHPPLRFLHHQGYLHMRSRTNVRRRTVKDPECMIPEGV